MFGRRTLRRHPEAGQLLLLAVGHVRYGTGAGARVRIGDVLLGVDEALQFLLLDDGIAFGLLLLLEFLLTLVLLHLATVFVLLGDDVLQDGLFVEQKSLLAGNVSKRQKRCSTGMLHRHVEIIFT